jgi:hypothetical protein
MIMHMLIMDKGKLYGIGQYGGTSMGVVSFSYSTEKAFGAIVQFFQMIMPWLG